ncbi:MULTISPECIES: MCE family protein [unclassified Streptomyces]|uniref:MCE family protein n=1 Tax=unclassified Streptomyces TaxID=2593676 RepID=UPI001BEB6650|nr:MULTISPECIES: MlaD family protein [unclassified Streptomyces]MBT2408013.1 MCE family protein [Streptomyces sp. ISL-21]MBT2611817.1 MCE family protein [Streptomyces sp. ISL-87]
MITGTVKTQLLAFTLVTVIGVSYVGAEYTGLAERVLDRGYTVRADFADSGGIYSGAEVTYRGVPVGRVGDLRLTGSGGVSVGLLLEDSPRIPADSLAVVANRSAVGEQYVDLQPRSGSGPYLRDGSSIPRHDTRVPMPTTDLILSLDRLVNSVDKQDLRITVDELGKGFSGTGPHLTRLVDSGNALVEAASDSLPQTIALIEDSRKVLKTQADQGSAITSFSRDLAALTAQLRASDGDIRALMANGTSAAQQVDSLMRDTRPHLPVLLGNLISGGQITLARLPGVEQMLVTFPAVVSGSYTVLPGDGTTHFGMVVNADDPPPCRPGYGTQRRDPADTTDRPANTGARCTAPRGGDTSVRGAQNAPGSRVQIGSTGGAQTVFGKDSWQWLLVGPMA